MDRERLLDLDRYLGRSRRIVFVLLALALLSLGPWLGWWTIMPLAFAAALFKVADSLMSRTHRPELAIFVAWCASEVVMAASVQISGGISQPTAAWMMIPVVTLSYRFPLRGVIVGVGFACILMLGLAALDIHAVLDNPPLLVAPMVLLFSVATFSIALLNADQKVRLEAVIDPLTGLLNRHALATRTAELAQQSAITRQPVGVVVVDLDHFKHINDAVGHSTGDAVLKDFGYLLRKQLRTVDMAYRIGGEEFLLLMPGAELEAATATAHRLRESIEADVIGGQKITLSLGVSCSAPGETFDYDRIFAMADAALYDAKRLGRNRVCVAAAGGAVDLPVDQKVVVV